MNGHVQECIRTGGGLVVLYVWLYNYASHYHGDCVMSLSLKRKQKKCSCQELLEIRIEVVMIQNNSC